MKCYDCKSEIEDDSWYCDQCGVKLYVCPDCRIPGKGEGKRCGKCGKPLVDAESLAKKGMKPEVPVNALPTKLVCDAQNITLELIDGALIGRVYGPYASQLSGLQFISANHATLKKGDDHWIIADVGSRNGTAVNGQWCCSPLPFRKGDIVRIANFYDFRAI